MSVPTEHQAAATAIRPFQVSMPEEDLVELRRRVQATRWPSKELVADASQGVQLATLQELARYWASEYDWRRCEAKLNALPQVRTFGDRPLLTVSDRQLPMLRARGGHGRRGPSMLQRGGNGHKLDRRVRPDRDDHLPRWQVAVRRRGSRRPMGVRPGRDWPVALATGRCERRPPPTTLVVGNLSTELAHSHHQ